MSHIVKTSLVAAATALACAAPALAVTQADLEKDGPYAVSEQKITNDAFGGGTVYSPNTAGKYGVVVVIPGFVSFESQIQKIGRRLATHGFVVATIGTKTIFDFPNARQVQLTAAVNQMKALNTGPAAGKIDASRVGVAGWSMGGGATLQTVRDYTPKLKAAVAFAPWTDNAISKFSTISVPTAILAAQYEYVAPNDTFSFPLYEKIPATTPKILAVLAGRDHFFPTLSTPNPPTSVKFVAWSKVFIDGDASYKPFLGNAPEFTEYRSSGL